MICKDCQIAGDINWLINSETATMTLATTLEVKVEENHNKCVGDTWCDCQHKLGKHFSLFAG